MTLSGDGIRLSLEQLANQTCIATTVVVDHHILGKPVDMDDAIRMIKLLAGRWHEVLTGVAVSENGLTRSALERTSNASRWATGRGIASMRR